MHVVIFEGAYWPRFAPLSLSRPVFTLISGMSTLLDKAVRHLSPSRLSLWVRPDLTAHVRERIVPHLPVPTTVNQPLDDQRALLVSGRTLHLRGFSPPADDGIILDEEAILRMAWTTRPGLSPEDALNRTPGWMELFDLPRHEPQARVVESPWDLIHWNEESLLENFSQFPANARDFPAGPWHLIAPEQIHLGLRVRLEPGCVLDGTRGPIVLAEGASVGANAVVQGPCYVGQHAAVLPLAIVRAGSSIGPMCRIGGEVSRSIIHGYSNKAHDGFLGDSYLGRWVNFGAGTVTSNLKNTYGEISSPLGGRQMPTGRRFAGTLAGDHVKTAVGTRLMAGTYLGFCAQVACTGHAPRCVPSYGFVRESGLEAYRREKAREVIERVYARRGRQFLVDDQRIMDYVAEAAPGVEIAPEPGDGG